MSPIDINAQGRKPTEGASTLFYFGWDFHYSRAEPDAKDKTSLVIEAMPRLGIIKADVIGGGIAATYHYF